MLNASAGCKAVSVGTDTLFLLKESKRYSELTGGAFSVTTRPLSALWELNARCGSVPSRPEIEQALQLVCDEEIELDEEAGTAMLKRFGQAVDFGGIAKGYAADEVRRILLEGGVTSALINLGGNVLAVGSKPDGSSFVIGIQDPESPRGNYLFSIKVDDESVVSSGDYERYFVYNGKIYHHILNPKTGFPADTNIKQVTIVTANSQTADGLSTSVLLLGVQKGIQLVESLDGVEAILITKDHYVYFTEGLRGRYEVEPELIKNYTITQNLSDLKN